MKIKFENSLKQLSKNLFFATLSILFVLAIFIGGFYFGIKSDVGGFGGKADAAISVANLNPFWKVWSIVENKFVTASSTVVISDEDKILGAIKGMVDSLDDPYTTFLLPEENDEFKETIEGNFSGVGMEVGKREGVLVVIAPLKGTPADEAGIKSGDVILEIDGDSTFDLTVDEAVKRIRGEVGTVVVITVGREGEDEPIIFEITRDDIKIPTLEYELRDDDIFVISLFNFSSGVEGGFRKALRQFVLSKTDKLILDLRGNPGGYLDAAVDVSSWFLPAGKVIVREDFGSNEPEKIFRSKGYDIFNNNLKMVILTDIGSASASEIVAGALKEHGVAVLIGERTFGKGSVQELIEITENTSLKVTIARWLTPEGNSISDGGLQPDIEVLISDEDEKSNIDSQLKVAVEYLNKK
jgi:carboxyl-terminal processing protease